MGTYCALSYANLYLGHWERAIFSDDKYVIWLTHLLCWFQFIDDLLIVWTRPRTDLHSMLEALNNNAYNLKFTYNISESKVSFLDLEIMLEPDGHITTNLFHKPSAGNTLLHATSAHLAQLVRSIPYAQYLWLCRNCIWEMDFHDQANKLQQRLLARRYSQSLLKKAYNKTQAKFIRCMY